MSERGPAFVVAACISREEKILLAQRNQPSNLLAHLKWELPGGKVNIEESPHQALVREIKEELGTDIKLVRLLPHVQSNIYHTTIGVVHSIVVAFLCFLSDDAPEPKPSESSVLEVRWVRKDDLSLLDLLPGTKQFIDCLERTDLATYGAE